MLSREQMFAQRASSLVENRKGSPWHKDYGRQCLHLPAMIHQCGICQTLAFLESKAKTKEEKQEQVNCYSALLDDLAEALEIPGPNRRQALIKKALTAQLASYQQLTREALQCANFFKRYAEAILKVELGDDVRQEG